MSVKKITEEEYNNIGQFNTQMSMFNLGQFKYVENKKKENRLKLKEELDNSLRIPNISDYVYGSKLDNVLDRIKYIHFKNFSYGDRILSGGTTYENCISNFNVKIEKNSQFFIIKNQETLQFITDNKYIYLNIGKNNDILFSSVKSTSNKFLQNKSEEKDLFIDENSEEKDLLMNNIKYETIKIYVIESSEPLQNEEITLLDNKFLIKTNSLLNVKLNDFNKLLLKNLFLNDELNNTSKELKLANEVNEDLDSQSDDYIKEIEKLESDNEKLNLDLKTIRDDLSKKFNKYINLYNIFSLLNIFTIGLLIYINIVGFETFINEIVFVSTKIYEISYLIFKNIIYYLIVIINSIYDLFTTTYNIINNYYKNEL